MQAKSLNMVLKNKNFLSLLLGQLVSSFGDKFNQLLILSTVLAIGAGSGWGMANILFWATLPAVLFGLLAGALVDRWDRKLTMVFSDLLRGLVVISFLILSLYHNSTGVIYLGVFLIAACGCFFVPARQALLLEVVDKRELLAANSILNTLSMILAVLGTLLGGVLVSGIGIRNSFFINAFVYFLSAVCIFFIKINVDTHRSNADIRRLEPIFKGIQQDIKIGLKYILRHRAVLRFALLSIFFMACCAAFYVGILDFMVKSFKINSIGFGIFFLSLGLGLGLGAYIITRLENLAKINGGFIPVSILSLGAGCFLFSQASSFIIALILGFCLGMISSSLSSLIDTQFQKLTPHNLRGRIFSVKGLFANLGFILTTIVAGKITDIFGPDVFLNWFGLGIILGVVVLYLMNYLRECLNTSLSYKILQGVFTVLFRLFFRLKIKGKENLPKKGAFIMVANHSSKLDPIVLTLTYPKRIVFLMADSVYRWKLCHRFFKKWGNIPVKEDGGNSHVMPRSIEALRNGFCLGIFPEGGLNNGEILSFRSGPARIAQETSLPIVPVGIVGTYQALPKERRFPHFWPIEVRIGRPLRFNHQEKDIHSLRTFTKKTQDSILELIAN